MELRERLYDIDDLWEIVCQADNANQRFELINGELFEMPPTGEIHGQLVMRLGRYLDAFSEQYNLGRVTGDSGYFSADDRETLLAPDVAFRRLHSGTEPPLQKWVPRMPDLAVEIVSPSNTMPQIRRKAAIYLQHGTHLVWIIIPDSRTAEVCKLDEEGGIQTESIAADGSLSGEDVLPGFELPLTRLFQ